MIFFALKIYRKHVRAVKAIVRADVAAQSYSARLVCIQALKRESPEKARFVIA
jgi:hypothetical protein